MDRDSCANLGFLAVLRSTNAIFDAARPAPTPDPEPDPVCVDCGGDLGDDPERCDACRTAAWKADDYGRDDADDRICGPLYDGN